MAGSVRRLTPPRVKQNVKSVTTPVTKSATKRAASPMPKAMPRGGHMKPGSGGGMTRRRMM